MYHFSIPHPPVAWKAPKQARWNTYSEHTPALKTIAALLETAWKAQMHTQPYGLAGALKISFTFVVPIPSSWSEKKKEKAKKGKVLPITRPDCSNYVKLTEDALTRSGIIRDDSIIVEANAKKVYGEHPHIQICIEELEQDGV
jgi:Holliday junction resolvase RusA-like endonuclease